MDAFLNRFRNYWSKAPELIKAFVTGQMIWTFLVFSYFGIVEPEWEIVSIILLVFSPPLSALMIYHWFKRFLKKPEQAPLKETAEPIIVEDPLRKWWRRNLDKTLEGYKKE